MLLCIIGNVIWTLAAASLAIAATCAKMCVRKEWRDMSDNDRHHFIAAIQTMRNKPSRRGQASLYHDFTDIHASNVNSVHHNRFFLVWHREFLARFEAELQKIDASVCLPYWDTGFDGQHPLYNNLLIGNAPTCAGTKSPNPNGAGYCIPDGFCAYWQNSNKDCLVRSYNPSTIQFRDNTVYATLIQNSASYDALSDGLAAAHDLVHAQLGGTMSNGSPGDMYMVTKSSNDIMFYFHHANVDRIWWRWQKQNPQRGGRNSSTAYSVGYSTSEVMPEWGFSVYNSLMGDDGTVIPDGSKRQYCSQYQTFSQTGRNSNNARREELEARDGKFRTHHCLSREPLGSGKHPKTVTRRVIPIVSDHWIAVNADSLGMNRTALKNKVRSSEARLDRIIRHFDEDLDEYLFANEEANYDRAYHHVVQNWKHPL
ncbi:hypothetical protein BC830DRAFT_1114027 [Chytriomyces sp. MP71]|nr:hypothetical protein BC830DRAFT_1114027 [Chytriomyces sp. MP71]